MVNPEGSRNLSQELHIRKNIVRVLTARQMEILTGSILGDAYIHPLGKICFEQSKLQKDYLLWKYAELKNLAYPKIAKVVRFDKRTGNSTTSFRFFLRQFFHSWRKCWYPQGYKTFPNNLIEWFTPLSLAVWYMDDGHFYKGKTPLFASECFSNKELTKIVQILRKWNLDSDLTKNNRLQILQSSTSHFKRLVSPYIVESMRYKILDPVTTRD